MNKRLIGLMIACLAFLWQAGFAQFEERFHNKTLRIDYIHAGDKNSEHYFLEEIKEEPYWGGSQVNLVDTFFYGNYFFKMLDAQSGELLYSRGYNTLFGEYQTIEEAQHTSKSFQETVVMPFPKMPVMVEFFSRSRKGELVKKFEVAVDPGDPYISPERRFEYPVFDALVNGDPAKKVDIVILPDGYTEAEMGRFINDCNNFADFLFQYAPYSENREQFNIRGVLAPSKESGNDIPADSVWRNTQLNTSFYTFKSERYCMTTANKKVRDLAANAPYDQIYILVNSNKYGGGAIYNHYSVSVNSNSSAAKIFVHEFGHGFVGLGDEYYMDEVAYSDVYPLDVEPWEPNLTTLVDFDKKWKHLLKSSVPIPTPLKEKYRDELGVFEGGGYAAKGVYRPSIDCLMHTFKGEHFCGACSEAIQRMIDYYCE